MVPIISAIIGFIIGWLRGGRNGGGTLDRLQFGAAHSIALGLLGLVASVIYIRMSM
jgi:hypothetical protein